MDEKYFFISYVTNKKENEEDLIFLKSDNNNEKLECIYSLLIIKKNEYTKRYLN